MRKSPDQSRKYRADDSHAACVSLTNHALRSIVASGYPSTHAFPILHSGANLRGQNSLVFVNARERRFLVIYCAFARAMELFKTGAPKAKTVRDRWKSFCRAYALFYLDDTGEVHVEDYAFTVRSRRELIRAFAVPLSVHEQRQLATLLAGGRGNEDSASHGRECHA